MKIHKNRNRQWSFLGITLYQCTVTRKTIPLDFQENSIRSIGSHLIIHHPDIMFFSLAIKDYIKWLSLAQQTFFLGIMHNLMEQKAKLVVHSKRHTFLCNTFSKISKEYRFTPPLLLICFLQQYLHVYTKYQRKTQLKVFHFPT